MFNTVFAQFLQTKTLDFAWVAFLILASDVADNNTILSALCIVGSIATLITNAYFKAKNHICNDKKK